MRRNRSATIHVFFQLCASLYQEYRNLAYETIYTESMLTRYSVTYSLSKRTRVLLVRIWSAGGSRKDCREIRAKLRLSPFLFVESGNNISLSYYTPIANRSWDRYTREPSLSFYLFLSLSFSLRIRTGTQNICTPVHASLFYFILIL